VPAPLGGDLRTEDNTVSDLFHDVEHGPALPRQRLGGIR
jgi:hypothetical protein